MRVRRISLRTESTSRPLPEAAISMYHGMMETKSMMLAALKTYRTIPGPAGEATSRSMYSAVNTMMQKVSISLNGERFSSISVSTSRGLSDK